MEQNVERDQRIMWAFGIAAGLAVIGALAPLAFTVGGHTRISGVAIPFGVAAVALAINAVTYHQGRTVAVAVYFVAGLAVVYGILAMLAVPLRIGVNAGSLPGRFRATPDQRREQRPRNGHFLWDPGDLHRLLWTRDAVPPRPHSPDPDPVTRLAGSPACPARTDL